MLFNSKYTPSRRGFMLMVTASALALSLGGHAVAEEMPDDLIAAAKAEGEVVVYVGGSVPVYQEIADAFEAKYGIRVSFLEARASEINERVRIEDTSNQVIGDLVYSGSASVGGLEEAGFIVPFGNLPNVARLDPKYEVTAGTVPGHVASWAVLVNTNLVKPEDEPKSWNDLLDPKWAGKILMDDPRPRGGGNIFFAAAYMEFGAEFHEKLRDQKPLFSRDYLVNPKRVAQGEYAVYLPMNVAQYPQLQGLPVKLLNMEEGNPFVLSSMGIRRNAPHPNAAKLLMNYWLEEESQVKFPAKGWMGVITDIDDNIPEDMRAMTNPKLMGKVLTPAEGDEMVEIAESIYGE